MAVYKINGRDYYRSSDLIALDHRRLRECDNDFDAFCKKYDLVDACIYASYDGLKDKWIQESSYNNKCDRDFIQTYAINKLCSFGKEPLPEPLKWKRLENTVDKSVMTMEIRGDEELYFRIQDVGKYLCVANLEEIIASDDSYISDIHCVYFWDNDWIMFMTQRGFLAAIEEYQPQISAYTLEWINDINLPKPNEGVERMRAALRVKDEELNQLKKTLLEKDEELNQLKKTLLEKDAKLERMRLSLRKKCLELVIKQAEVEIRDIDLAKK